MSFVPTPVGVWPPFMFLVYNGSYDNEFINRSSDNCFYSMCWNASVFSLAVVTCMPRFVPWPVQAPSVMTLFRPKRDFEITAAIVTAISHLKEWAGIGGLAIICVATGVMALWCICHMQKKAYPCTGTVDSGFCSPRAGTVFSSVAWHAREVVNDG